ncbi:ATP-binding protein [Mucilaginibacter sp.]
MKQPCQNLRAEQIIEVLSRYKNAIAIYTTSEIIIESANDAMIAFWGKDRSVIGKRLIDAVPELKGQPFIPTLKKVMRTGIDDIGKARPATLLIDGRMQTFYFDYEYRAIKDEHGRTYCILNTAEDVTERELNRQALRSRTSELVEAQFDAETQRDHLSSFFMQAPAAICILDGPNLVFELINPLYQQLFPGRELLGKPILEALPEIKYTPVWDILHDVYASGNFFEGVELPAPLSRTSEGPVEDRYFNFIYQPRVDKAGNVDGIIVFAFEVTEMVHVKRNVEGNEKRYKFLLNTMPQQVWTATPDGETDYVNKVVCDDLGYDLTEITGRGWQNFVHPDDLAVSLARWEDALATGKEYMVELRFKFRDGKYYWHLSRGLPFVEDGVIKKWFGTNTNIHLRKEQEYKKDEFLSIASHELKTPLTSIKAYNQIMQKLEVPEKISSFIIKSAKHITRLERLIADLLDVTKINAGKVSYSMEPFNFAEMLVDSIESLKHTSNNHQLILSGKPDITYNGDRSRLEQVLNNFVSNAVKYSPEGSKVFINGYEDQDNIIVSVQDFGIGIARENLNKLFDRYYRVDNTAMRFEGLGLGLYISAEILRRHGGSFWIESELGAGSTFYFRLPIHHSEKKEEVHTDTFFRNRHITVNYNQLFKRVDVDWLGYQDLESVQHGCLMMLEIIKKNSCKRVVNNNRHVLGNWSEASDWVGQTYFPMMESAGVKCFAWVFSSNGFSQMAAQKTIAVSVGKITTQFFTDVALAEKWIEESC